VEREREREFGDYSKLRFTLEKGRKEKKGKGKKNRK